MHNIHVERLVWTMTLRIPCESDLGRNDQARYVPHSRADARMEGMNRLKLPTSRLLVLTLTSSVLIFGCAPTPSDRVEEPKEVTRSVDVSGMWMLNVESPMGREDIVARLEQTGTALSGAMNSNGVDVPLRGDIRGDAIQFDMTLDVRGSPLTFKYNGTVQGDAMTGTVQFGPMGTGKFSGRRKQ